MALSERFAVLLLIVVDYFNITHPVRFHGIFHRFVDHFTGVPVRTLENKALISGAFSEYTLN